MKNIEKKEFRIVFMGTPDFAVESLKALVENGYNVVGVITMPDKPAGRGYKLKPSPVKQYALQQGLKVLQPEKLRDEGFLSELKQLNADLQVVAAFRMLPEVVWNMPLRGTFNLHSSLLPQYRGAAPINWAIINGEEETGVTTFFLKHEIDTGNIIFQEKEAILPQDNLGSLYEKLMQKGAQLVLKTIEAIAEGNVQVTKQDESLAKHPAPKIFKETGEIDWKRTAVEVHNLVRGLSPYPAAWTKINGKTSKVFATELLSVDIPGKKAGEYQSDGKSYLHFQTGEHAIAILELQMEGKKRMSIEEFLR